MTYFIELQQYIVAITIVRGYGAALGYFGQGEYIVYVTGVIGPAHGVRKITCVFVGIKEIGAVYVIMHV